MKLRNKKTGEIIDIYKGEITLHYNQGRKTIHFKHLEDLEEWEDYEEPKEWYWFIEDNGVIQRSCHYEDLHPTLDKARKEISNYFNSREEAQKAVEKLKAWKRLKDKGFRFDCYMKRSDWAGLSDVKALENLIDITAYLQKDKIKETEADLDLLFGGEDE